MGKTYREISQYKRLRFVQGDNVHHLLKHMECFKVTFMNVFKYVMSLDVICFNVGFLSGN